MGVWRTPRRQACNTFISAASPIAVEVVGLAGKLRGRRPAGAPRLGRPLSIRLREEDDEFLDRLQNLFGSTRTDAVRFCIHMAKLVLDKRIGEMETEVFAGIMTEALRETIVKKWTTR